MVREDLIEGAMTFLQDPSVSNAPLEQRVAFLRSKNLTQDEIDASLARVGQATPSQAAASPPATYSNQHQSQSYRPQQQYGYNNYQQAPPNWPDPTPRRDWRDWFIMATVITGVSYGLYWTAHRYVYPLIAPPTPPQLEADKAHIDASFDKAFTLLDQLSTDTQELKDAEKQRTERLDRAVSEVEAVLARLKEANEARELEGKRVAREVGDLREAIPRAIEREKETTDGRLKDLVGEMRSLKTLVANRMAQPSGGVAAGQRPAAAGMQYATPSQQQATHGVNGTAAPPTETNGTTNGTQAEDGKEVSNLLSSSSPPSSTPLDRPASATSSLPFSSGTGGGRLLGGGKAQIPAWQLAAKRRNEEAAAAKKENASAGGEGASDASTPAAQQQQDVAQSGTVGEAEREATS